MKKSSLVITLILGVLLAASLFFSAWLYWDRQNREIEYGQYYDLYQYEKKENESLSAEIESRIPDAEKVLREKEELIRQNQEEIAGLEQELASLREKAGAAEERAAVLRELSDVLNDGTLYGYGSDNFRTNEGIVVLNAGGRGRTLILRAAFDESFDLDYDVNGESADIFWNEETWGGSHTTVEIVPSETQTGITVFEIHNSLDDSVCKICAVVIPSDT